MAVPLLSKWSWHDPQDSLCLWASQFGTHAMTFQSISKINSSSPPNITAHGASAPWSDMAIAVAFRYTGSKPRLAFLLIKAVLSPQGKCACIPLVRSVLLCPLPFPPPTTPPSLHHGQRGNRGGESAGLFPAAVPLFLAPDQGPRCAQRQQQQFEQCESPVGLSTCKCNTTI